MIRLWGPLLLILACGLAQAQGAGPAAMVRGGEHPGFTRLTVETGVADWRFGRSGGGYALQLPGDVAPFDLDQAFLRISRSRIADLRQDATTGRLQITLGCSCHAIAFAYRPGLIVLDIRPGPAPPGSAFELPLDIRPDRQAAPPQGYDWLQDWRAAPPVDTAGLPAVPPPSDLDLGPLRDALLARISRGVAEGVIEIAEPLPVLQGVPGAPPGSRIANGILPGIAAAVAHDPPRAETADGRACLTDDALNLSAWVPQGGAAEGLVPPRAGLLAEFDRPDPQTILQAARAHIALGFGGEARQILDLLPRPAPTEVALLHDLAAVVDLRPPPGAALQGMAGCDGAAALWSLLAHAVAGGDDLPPHTDLGAVTRGFAALPPHLRRHLAPALTRPLLHAEEDEALRRLRDALLRAAPQPDAAALMVDAQYRLSVQDAPGAHDQAAKVMTDPAAEGASGVTLLVESAFVAGIALPAGTAAQVAAFLRDAGPEQRPGLLRARVVALGLEGDFQAAFEAARAAPSALPDLWTIAAEGADDDTFLAAAVAQTPPADLPAATGMAIAGRLQALGFARDALTWLGPLRPEWGEGPRLILARAQLQLRDARAALTALAGLTGPPAEEIRARAALQLGDSSAAAAAYSRMGNDAAAARAWALAQDMPQLAAQGPPAWQAAAALLQPAPAAAPAGPLAQGAALLADSSARRRVVEALVFPPAAQAP